MNTLNKQSYQQLQQLKKSNLTQIPLTSVTLLQQVCAHLTLDPVHSTPDLKPFKRSKQRRGTENRNRQKQTKLWPLINLSSFLFSEIHPYLMSYLRFKANLSLYELNQNIYKNQNSNTNCIMYIYQNNTKSKKNVYRLLTRISEFRI